MTLCDGIVVIIDISSRYFSHSEWKNIVFDDSILNIIADCINVISSFFLSIHML